MNKIIIIHLYSKQMREEIVFFPNLQLSVTFYIGENAQDNFDMIDKCNENDYWFHATIESSCHVVANLSNIEKIKKQKMHTIIHQGALLCKKYTNKLSKKDKIGFIYTKIKNITKTEFVGRVIALDTKEIFV